MIRKFGGVMMLMFGILLLCWLGYNFFIEMQAEMKGRSPFGALIFSCALIGVGWKWAMPKKIEE